MKRLLPSSFGQITLQHQAQRKGWVGWLSPKLVASSLMLKLALCTGISLAIGIAPVASAYTTQDEVTVYPEVGEDYNALTRRAETAARSLAQRRFDTDILQTRVIVTILTENNGQIAPILTLDVNRNDWRRRPDPQVWATYYHSTRSLLNMGGSGAARSTQPPSPPIVQPTAPSQSAPTNPTSPTSPEETPTRRVPVPSWTPSRPSTPTSPTPNSPAGNESTPNNRSSSGGVVNPNPIDLPIPSETGIPRSILR